MSPQDFIIEIIMISAFEAILLFQFAYVISQWIFIRRPEYLWYAAYISGMAIYTLVIYEYVPVIQLNDEYRINPRNHLDKFLPFICYFFYYRFARAFLDMKTELPTLNKYIKYLEYFILSYCIIDLVWKFIGQNPDDGEFVFHICSTILFICSLILIFIFLNKKIKLSYFIVFGAIIISIGSFGTMILMMREQAGYETSLPPFMLNNIAVVIELLAFTTGLAYKARLEEIEKVKFQKSLILELNNNLNLINQIQTIRKGIALEIHSEIGENVSDISIYSALASKSQNNNPNETRDYLAKIQQTSLEVVANMQDFIWTLYPEHASLTNLILKLEQIQNELLRPNNISFKLTLQESVNQENINLPLDFNRLNIGLFRKICLHAVKSNAESIMIYITEDALTYTLPLNDNTSVSIDDFLFRFKKRFNAAKIIQTNSIEIRISIPKISY